MKLAEPRVECPKCGAHMYELNAMTLFCSVCNHAIDKEIK